MNTNSFFTLGLKVDVKVLEVMYLPSRSTTANINSKIGNAPPIVQHAAIYIMLYKNDSKIDTDPVSMNAKIICRTGL